MNTSPVTCLILLTSVLVLFPSISRSVERYASELPALIAPPDYYGPIINHKIVDLLSRRYSDNTITDDALSHDYSERFTLHYPAENQGQNTFFFLVYEINEIIGQTCIVIISIDHSGQSSMVKKLIEHSVSLLRKSNNAAFPFQLIKAGYIVVSGKRTGYEWEEFHPAISIQENITGSGTSEPEIRNLREDFSTQLFDIFRLFFASESTLNNQKRCLSYVAYHCLAKKRSFFSIPDAILFATKLLPEAEVSRIRQQYSTAYSAIKEDTVRSCLEEILITYFHYRKNRRLPVIAPFVKAFLQCSRSFKSNQALSEYVKKLIDDFNNPRQALGLAMTVKNKGKNKGKVVLHEVVCQLPQ